MINQRAYPDILLGTGTGNQTVANYGCYLVSLLQGLLDRGYSYSVYQFDKLLESKNIFVQNTLISASALSKNIPEIFEESRVESWNDAKFIKYINDKNYIVLGEVDARGIGGGGQHFVYVQRADVEAGKVKMAYVGDPWGGLDNQKITTRYNKYGNIKSLRIFKVKVKSSSQNNSEGETMPNDYDAVREDRDKHWNRLVKLTTALGIEGLNDSNVDQRVDDAIKAHSDGVNLARERGYAKGYQEGLSQAGSTSPVSDIVDLTKYEENGKVVEETVGNKKIITNYKKK